jgi:quercetin dioxygenase-like cupin family protein
MLNTHYSSITPFTFGDLQIRELTLAGLTTASVAEITVPPAAAHPRARSSKCTKLYTCLDGCINFEVGEEQIELAIGDVLFIPINAWFSYRNATTAPAHLLLMHIPPFDMSCEEFAAG